MAQTGRQKTGRWGEDSAAAYLEQRGYSIVARNVRTPYGELDLIASHPQAGLVFVEVKTRTNLSFGFPEEGVDARKLEHVFRAADAYLHEHPDLFGQEWRIDVIAIYGKPGGKEADVQFEHFENISD
jgi:putative endonuclease